MERLGRKVFNIKQMAAALAYIQDNNLTDYEQLAKESHRGRQTVSMLFPNRSSRRNRP